MCLTLIICWVLEAAPCAVDFKNTTEGLEEPKDYSNFAEFSLSYIQMEDKPAEIFDWEPRFAGHQTLEERKETFHVRDQMVHCGFVQAPEGYPLTGFEFSDSDAEFLQTCHIAVSSCIFGNWDRLRFPTNKKVSGSKWELLEPCWQTASEESSWQSGFPLVC